MQLIKGMREEQLVGGVDGSDLLCNTAFIQQHSTLACLISEWSEDSVILPTVRIAGCYGNLKTQSVS